MAKRGTATGKKKAGRSRRAGGSSRARTTRKGTGAARRSGGSRRSAQRAEASRQLRAEDAGATEIPVVIGPESGRDAGEAQDRGEHQPQAFSVAAEWTEPSGAEVHEIEEAAQRREAERAAREALRAYEASVELERRRYAEEEGRAFEERRELPGVTSMAVELLLGGMRLVRAVATAPIRLGLAFLDRSA